MNNKYILLVTIVFLSSCLKYDSSEITPMPEISFYEGRDYWNNPIYLRSDTTVTGKKTRAFRVHFAAAAGIKKITISQNNAVVFEQIEDNETDFNEELSHAITPEMLPSSFTVKFRVEDWEDKVSEKVVKVNFK